MLYNGTSNATNAERHRRRGRRPLHRDLRGEARRRCLEPRRRPRRSPVRGIRQCPVNRGRPAGLIGWTFGIDVFKSFIPGQVVIKPNAAVALVLCGYSLWLLRSKTGMPHQMSGRGSDDVRRRGRRPRALTLSEHLGGWDSGIEQVFFTDGTPGRRLEASARYDGADHRDRLPSPRTRTPHARFDDSVPFAALRAAQFLAFAANTTAIVGLLDFILGSHTSYTHIALQTAVTLFLLSFAVACARTSSGLGALLASSSVAAC